MTNRSRKPAILAGGLVLLAGVVYATVSGPPFRSSGGMQMDPSSATTCPSGKQCLWVDNGTPPRLRFDDGTTSNKIAAVNLAAKGDLAGYTGSVSGVLGVGTNGQVLSADSTQTYGLAWVPPGYNIVEANGTPRSARSKLNFLSRFTAVDNSPGTDVDLADGQVSNAKLANSGFTMADGVGTTGSGSTSLGASAHVDLVATAVTPGSYGDGTHVLAATVDAYGRLTAAAATAIAGLAEGAITGLVSDLGGKLSTGGGTLTGALLFSSDNTLDVGASGATRPRTCYVGTSVVVPTVGPTSSRQHTLPNVASDTVALLGAAQTLTAKSIDGAANTLSSIQASSLANSGVSAAAYGDASHVAACTYNAGGQATTCASTAIALAASAITSGQFTAARGGTGLSSAGGVANRALVTTDGTNFSVGTVPLAALPTGQTSSTVPLGNDSRFPPTPTTNGAFVFEALGAYAEHVLAVSDLPNVFTGTAHTTNATPAAAATYTVPSGKSVLLHLFIVARQNGTTAQAWEYGSGWSENSGSLSQIGAFSTQIFGLGTAGWSVSISNLSGTVVTIQVTGAGGTTIDWSVRGDVVVAP